MPLPSPTVTPDIVVIGASAGGVPTLLELVAALPANFPAAILLVQHIPAYAVSHLPELLSRAGPLPARHPQHGDPLLTGTIYVAPPNHHPLLEDDRVLVTRGPKENRFRPSVDTLFRSAAYARGPRVIAQHESLSGLSRFQRSESA